MRLSSKGYRVFSYDDGELVMPYEDLDKYTAGGFHPVNLGDTFQGGRYTLITSQAWLWRLFDRVARSFSHREPMPFARLLDCFHHTGPNGTHNCLCYEYRGQTLRPDTVLRASCQLLDALTFFHQAGFAHGDISSSNVAFICRFDDEEDLFESIEDPHLVKYTIWPGWYEPDEQDLRLIDVGDSFPIGDTFKNIAQPWDVRSPETFFTGSFNYRHDLWRAGCVIYSLYYQKKPFEAGFGPEASFILRLGECEYFEEYESRFSPQLIIDTLEPRCNDIISNCNIQDSIYHYRKDEFTQHYFTASNSLFWVIQRLLQFQPDKRISLQEAVSHI
ncbi:kinase-like domain-containing protein [Nemania serpens]|nr:kinase-like domain-containing protein [Nemania serpens]